LVICLLNVSTGFLLCFTKSSHNCENYGFFGLKIRKIFFRAKNKKNNFFLCFSLKNPFINILKVPALKLTMGEAEMCYMQIFLNTHKAI